MIDDKSFEKTGLFKRTFVNKELIDSCTQYLDFVFYIQNQQNEKEDLWFRGVSSSEHLPVPRYHRVNFDKHPLLENFLFTKFIQKAKRFKHNLENKSEWLQLMQHYGLPTRLLDWTEGALIALFFAVKYSECNIPSVWIINPIQLNKIVIGKRIIPVTESIISEDDDEILHDYHDLKNLPEYPIAISPSYFDERIQAQKSVFTFHGRNYNDISKPKITENMNFYLLRFETKSVDRIRKQLQLLGIDESTLFPDLEGISRDLEFQHELGKQRWHLQYKKM